MEKIRAFLVLANAFISPSTFYSQQSQFSVFPLVSGLEYRYEYFGESIARDMLVYFRVSLDSGVVRYVVRDSLRVNDSVAVWRVLTVSSLRHWRLPDTTYYTYDSTVANLYENLTGRHELTCSTLVWSFPLRNPLQPIYRFSDSSSVKIVRGEILPFSSFADTLWFSSDSGFARRQYYSNVGSIQNGTSTKRLIRLLAMPLVSVEERGRKPERFYLNQNYPNPFNPTTSISFTLGHSSFVQLKVFDVLGREVATLVNEEKGPGSHEVGFDASRLSSGIYFYQLRAGNFLQTKKMVLLQ